MGQRNKRGDKHLDEVTIDGKNYDIYGCWDEETPENEYEFYDVYHEGNCINLGEPFWEYPTKEDIKEFVDEGLSV